MSQRPISLSPDLQKLRNEGYDLEIRSAFLLVKDVPYVNSSRQVKRGTLVCALTLAGDVTAGRATMSPILRASIRAAMTARKSSRSRTRARGKHLPRGW